MLEDLLSESDIPDGDSKLENYEDPEPNEKSDAITEDQEMEGAVRRQIEQQAYRENILQEMRDLVTREKDEAIAIKQEADEVAEKNRKENERLKESWNKYHKSNKNLEKRVSAVSDREKKAMAKELELAQREDDIKQRESETNAVKADNEEKSKELERKIEENHNLLKTLESRKENLDERERALDTREKALDVRQERIEMDRKTVDQSVQDMYAMERMLKELKGKVAPVDTSKYEREIKALREEKEHYYDFVKKTATVIAGYKKQIEEAAAINEQLQEQVRTLAASLKEQSEKQADSTELISARSQLEDATKKLQDEQRKSADFENELNELKRKNNELSEKLASSVREPVIETLSSAGYTVSPIAGEGNPLITFEIDGCTAIIDEHLGMVCLEKKVKRNYVKTFDAWNSQSFAETYSMSKGKAYCRFAYENIIEDIRRIAAKLNTLK